jgi:hypothetical protein
VRAVAKRRPANEGSLHFYLEHRPITMLSEKKVRSRLNLAGQRVVVSNLACIRWSAAAMSAKNPPSRKEREKGWAPRVLGAVHSWATSH